MKVGFSVILLTAVSLFSSCRSSEPSVFSWFDYVDSTAVIYAPQYACNFLVTREQGKTILYLRDNASSGIPERYEVPRLSKAVCLSTTHAAYLTALQASDCICGLSGTRYVYDSLLQARIAAGRIIDVGYEASIDFEALLSLHPDVVFAYSIPGQPTDYITKMKQLGLYVIPIPEYTEPHPLGKAEFLRVFATFLGLETKADSLFHHTRVAYEAWKQQVQSYRDSTQTEPIPVLVNAPFKDVWFVPAQSSHLAQFISDAGGTLLGASPGLTSQPVPTEQMYTLALQAHVWLHPNHFTTRQELKQLDERFATIPCFSSQQVWNNNLRSSSGGGSDFFESGAVYPHLILADLIAIFHPTLLSEHTFTYYRRLD